MSRDTCELCPELRHHSLRSSVVGSTTGESDLVGAHFARPIGRPIAERARTNAGVPAIATRGWCIEDL
jgi:hypothetical protein